MGKSMLTILDKDFKKVTANMLLVRRELTFKIESLCFYCKFELADNLVFKIPHCAKRGNVIPHCKMTTNRSF